MEVRDHVIGDLIGRRDRVLRIDRGILIASAVAVRIDIVILLCRGRESREIRVHVAPDSQFLSDLIGDINLSGAFLLDLHRHGIDRAAGLAEDSVEGILQRYAGDLVAAIARILGGIRDQILVLVQKADADLPGEGDSLGIGVQAVARAASGVRLDNTPHVGRGGAEIMTVSRRGLLVTCYNIIEIRGALQLVDNVKLSMQRHHLAQIIGGQRDRTFRAVVADEDIDSAGSGLRPRGNDKVPRSRIQNFAELKSICMRHRQVPVVGLSRDDRKIRILKDQTGRQIDLQVRIPIIIIEGFGAGVRRAAPVASRVQCIQD